MRSLAIISHTVHCREKSGKIIGWEPTIREINHLTTIFDKIYHIAPLHKRGPLNAMANYKGSEITFVPLIPSGGNHLKDKLSVLRVMPNNCRQILKVIRAVDWIHFRAPCNLGIYILPLLSIIRHKNIWIKYAGNWGKNNIPISYFLQRWWLKKNIQRSAVTINGSWNNQAKHLLTFNNPCISDEELQFAQEEGKRKCFSDKINLCFVGRTDQNKGVERLISALKIMSSKSKLEHWINEINIIGGSNSDKELENRNSPQYLEINILGWLNREKLNQIYSKSHFLILPTQSEGFPKVIPEAAAFGCIPVVTNVDPINQYIIHNNNGLLLKSSNTEDIMNCLFEIQNKCLDYKQISLSAMGLAHQFTFSHYISKLESEILND